MTIRVSDIIAATADAFGVGAMEIVSDRQSSNIIQPRRVCAFLACELTPHSQRVIGDVLNRDRTSVLHAVKTIKAELEADPALAEKIARLANGLRERDRIMSARGHDVLSLASAIGRNPKREALAASSNEVAAMAIALCGLWEVASAAEALIADLGACAIEGDPDRVSRMEALSAAILDEIHHIAGTDPENRENGDMQWKL